MTRLQCMINLGQSPEICHELESDHFIFIPKHWSKDGEHISNTFAHVPFGFGARMCVDMSQWWHINAITVSNNKYTDLQIAELELHIKLTNSMKISRLAFS